MIPFPGQKVMLFGHSKHAETVALHHGFLNITGRSKETHELKGPLKDRPQDPKWSQAQWAFTLHQCTNPGSNSENTTMLFQWLVSQNVIQVYF